MGSPEDQMLEMRKRQKMARLQQNANQAQQRQQQPVPQPEPASVGGFNLNTCDLGASPNLQPKVMKPYRTSPL